MGVFIHEIQVPVQVVSIGSLTNEGFALLIDVDCVVVVTFVVVFMVSGIESYLSRSLISSTLPSMTFLQHIFLIPARSRARLVSIESANARLYHSVRVPRTKPHVKQRTGYNIGAVCF